MIRDTFNRRFPVDKTVVGSFGRFAIVRGSFPSPKGAECRYGIFILNAENAPMTDDGVSLSFDEVRQLADLLPTLISTGKIRDITPPAEFKAAVEAREAAKKTPPRLW